MKKQFDEAMRNLVRVKNPNTGEEISYGTRVNGRRISAHSLEELAARVKELTGSIYCFPEQRR